MCSFLRVEKLQVFLDIRKLKFQNFKITIAFLAVILSIVATTIAEPTTKNNEEDLSPPRSTAKHALNQMVEFAKNHSIYFDYKNIKAKKVEFQNLRTLILYMSKKRTMENYEILDRFIDIQRVLKIPHNEYGFFGPKMINYFETQI